MQELSFSLTISCASEILLWSVMFSGTGLKDYNRVRAYKHILGDLYYTEEEVDQLYEPQVDEKKDLPVIQEEAESLATAAAEAAPAAPAEEE